MGKLKLYGAIGGIGKGLNKEAEMRFASEEAEAKDARIVQLERQRNKAAQERQDKANKATAQREKDRYGPGGYAEVAAKHAGEIKSSEAVLDRQHQTLIEQMRQKGETSRATARITQKDKAFEYDKTPSSSYFDAKIGETVVTSAQNRITDKATKITYLQDGLKFIPEGMTPPSEGDVKAGQALIPWLLSGKNLEQGREYSLVFLEAYHYLPPQYFSKYGDSGPVTKITEKGSASTATPTNPVVQ